MVIDFRFTDDGRTVSCRQDGGAWYLWVDAEVPVCLGPVVPGETRREVWERALSYLDGAALEEGDRVAPLLTDAR